MREFRLDGYRNIYELLPNETRIFGTESLYGDWGAEILLLAKDFAPSYIVEERKGNGDPRPFRHCEQTDPFRPDCGNVPMGWTTNRNLQLLVGRVFDADPPLLYGSALAGLLRADGRTSGKLPNEPAALEYGARVLAHVVEYMPRLRAVACLGKEAWNCTLAACRCSSSLPFSAHRDRIEPIRVGERWLFAVNHPRDWTGGKVQVLRRWTGVRDAL